MVDHLVVGHAGADGIGQAHIPAPDCIDQPRNAQPGVLPEDARVEKIVIDPPVNHIDRLAAFGRAHENTTILREEVAAFHDLDAHRAGEE